MKTKTFAIAGMFTMACAMLFSCKNDVDQSIATPEQPDGTTLSRAYGDKTPKIMAYYEINDVNPLNALCYEMGEGKKFIDIVQLFASNIHKQTVTENGVPVNYPTIYFNDKLTPVMADAATYIQPIRAAGIKVVLNVLGDWKGIGVSNLNAKQADKFADILVYIVETYNLDGIGFDDEYSQASPIAGSYSHVIKALRAKLDQKFGVRNKLITVFQWGATGQIDAAAGAMIDYADHGWFEFWHGSSSISGMSNDRWSPLSINMGSSYSLSKRNKFKNFASDAKNGNYGALMMFNVRAKSNVNPQPVFQALATGAFGGTITNVAPFEYAHNWTPVPAGHEITKDDVPSYSPVYTGN